MSKYFPALPRPSDVANFCRIAKEVLEKGLGRIGQKNKEGRFYDEWITRRNLIDEILSSQDIYNAINYAVSIGMSMNDPVDKYIVSGVITVDGQGLVTIYSETGTTDVLDKVEGLSKGQSIYIIAGSGHTITVTAGTYLKLPSPTWTLSSYRIATLDCMGGDICVMRSHEANRS